MRAVRAVVAHAAGDLRVESRDPVTLEPGQVAVRVAFGGVCGSDLHYYHRGGVGDFLLREPLVLGHEVSGTVLEAGPQTDGPQTDAPPTDAPPPGTPVTVHPATPCGTCAQCAAGRPNICPRTRYLGSAAHLPHVQGGFIDVLVVRPEQLVVLPAGLERRASTEVVHSAVPSGG